MDAAIFSVLFLVAIVAFVYLSYKLYQKSKWRQMWAQVGQAIWAALGFLMFLSGFLYGNIVTMVLGLATAFASVSFFLIHYIKSEPMVKRFLETIFGAASVGIIIYGYVITGSLILETIILFIFIMVLIAFTLSYGLPKIHEKADERQRQTLETCF